MDKYSQLLTKIFEFILKILIHVKTDINSVIIKVTRFITTIVRDFNQSIFNMNFVAISTIG